MTLLYRNRDQVIALARRRSDEYAAFTDENWRKAKYSAVGARGDSRYRAINTRNEHTFELRIFASSLVAQAVAAALGLAAASMEYTRTLPTAVS